LKHISAYCPSHPADIADATSFNVQCIAAATALAAP
jgi:hypothetical protein